MWQRRIRPRGVKTKRNSGNMPTLCTKVWYHEVKRLTEPAAINTGTTATVCIALRVAKLSLAKVLVRLLKNSILD